MDFERASQPLMTPMQVTYNNPPIPPPYGPVNTQRQQTWAPTMQSNMTASAPQQQQGFSSMFPPPPPPPPKPHQYSTHPPPLPPRPGTQGASPNQTSTWSRPPEQTAQIVSNSQDTPPSAHHIYRKYGHVMQGTSGAPLNAFTPTNPSYGHRFTTDHQQPSPWSQPVQATHQHIHSPIPQQHAWQEPTVDQQLVSPIQQPAQPYAPTQTPVNQMPAPSSHIFQSPATHTPPAVPSVSPPPYNYAYPPPPPGRPPQSDLYGRENVSDMAQEQIQRPCSIGNNPYNPPVSPPIPTVSPLVSRQGSLVSQPGRGNERQDTVSSISTGPVHERHNTVPSISTAVVDMPATPKVESSGSIDLQSGSIATGGGVAGTSASALGFGGPGGWEYYAPLEGDTEDVEEDLGKNGAKYGMKKQEDEPVSPVELPSEPVMVKEEVAAPKREGDTEEEGIYELPADSSMGDTIRPAASSDKGEKGPASSETTVLPKPNTRYNRIPRSQDLIPDLGPWYASSLERYIAMLKQEAYAGSDEQRMTAFMEFVAMESQIRGIPYYTQLPGQTQDQTPDQGQKKPKLPLDIPSPNTGETATEDIQYSPGGRPILRTKATEHRGPNEVETEVVQDGQPSYKPFRRATTDVDSEGSTQQAVPALNSITSDIAEKASQPASVATSYQSQYKPYTPGTPTVETIRKESFPRRESFPHRSSVSSPTATPPVGKHEHAETFFPAPLALRAKRDRTSTPPASASKADPPHAEEDRPSTTPALPYPTTSSWTPPPPLPPSTGTRTTSHPSTPPLSTSSSQTGLARLKALLTNPAHPVPLNPLTQQTLSALPSLATTRAHITSLRETFDKSSPEQPSPLPVPGSTTTSAAVTRAQTLFATLASERSEMQTLNDMAFESHEITYPELLARDEALKREEVERVAAAAEGAGADEAKAYARWEADVFASVYERVREEVDRGVDGLAVVEDVGAGAIAAWTAAEDEGEEDAAPASGLVKINARTGEVIVVDGLAPAGGGDVPTLPPASNAPPPPKKVQRMKPPPSVESTAASLRTLNESTRALLALHTHISARHTLLADAVAERDARYARAQVAPLEFLVAFDDLENPAAAAAAAASTVKAPKANAGGGDAEGKAAAEAAAEQDDTRKKLCDLKRHFTSARLAAAARAAAEEEVRARQTWQRVEGWMGAGVGVVTETICEIASSVREVEKEGVQGGEERSEVRGLLDRAEAVVKRLAGEAEELVRAFYEAEVLLNEAEFAVSVQEARVAVFEKAVEARRKEGWEKEAENVIGKLRAEKRKEDGVLKEELDGRLNKVGEEQREKAVRAIRRVRAKVVGREEFEEEDRIVGWVT
ncbi:hypothetical protein B0J12DRAFT_233013 [Macrophomina phaseolina]|uniref:Uncharacterized protein n=1 Tax=Macrophomina phaseolina TaxID=35725 RepID=A0ABQ8GQT7_9PEZI|nr:hypothetical protein B0J12DRAFT_233013 [Macrophomina phaseolina]